MTAALAAAGAAVDDAALARLISATADVSDLSDAAVLDLVESDERGERRARVYVGQAHVLVVGAADEAGRLVVEAAPVSALPVVLGRFAGLRPSPVVDGADVVIDAADLRARLSDPSAPAPADAPAALREAWARPWRRWTVTGPGVEGLDHVDAGDAGQIRVRELPDGRVGLLTRPEGLVWGDLQRVPAALAAQRAGDESDASDW